jgi:hypothetical protein
MRVHIELTGTTPLMMHNERLSDSDDAYVKPRARSLLR